MLLALVASQTFLRVGMRLMRDRMDCCIFRGEFKLFSGGFGRIKDDFVLKKFYYLVIGFLQFFLQEGVTLLGLYVLTEHFFHLALLYADCLLKALLIFFSLYTYIVN